MPRVKWTRDRILLEIRRLDARGESLAVRALREVGLGGMVATAYKLFGTWRQAVEAAGVRTPRPRVRYWTLQRIVAEIRGLEAQGQDLSYSAVRKVAPRLVAAAYRSPQLGNWTRALEAAGLSSARGRRRRWSRRQITEEIRALAARGESLAFADALAQHTAVVRAACSPRYFGSWAAAVQAAGVDYEAVRKRRRWTAERVIAAIKHLHAQGVVLTTSGVRKAGWSRLVEAARQPGLFGSWREAVECAGIDYETVRRAGLQVAPTRGKLPVGNSGVHGV